MAVNEEEVKNIVARRSPSIHLEAAVTKCAQHGKSCMTLAISPHIAMGRSKSR